MPPKNLLKVYGLIFVIALVAVVIVTMIVMASGAHAGSHAKLEVDRDSLVRIQVRAPQRVAVIMNGHPKGQTPLMLLVPRSETPVELSVTLGGRSITKQVTPREDSVLDFP